MTRPGSAKLGPDWNALLGAEMDRAKLDFAPRLSASGRLSGGFRYAEAQGPTLPFEVAVRNGALTVQTAVGGGGRSMDLEAVSGFNQLWGPGRIIANTDQDQLQLAGGYPIFARKPDAPLLRIIVEELYAVAVALDPTMGGSWAAAAAAVAMVRGAYPAPVPGVFHQIAGAFAATGYPFASTRDHGLRGSFQEPDENAFAMDIAESADGFVLVRSRPVGAVVQTPERLNRLTAAAPLGCFVSEESGGLMHFCALPEAWISINPRLVLWLIELGAQMCALSRLAMLDEIRH